MHAMEALPPLPLVLTLVPLYKFPIDFKDFPKEVRLQNEKGLALLKMKL